MYVTRGDISPDPIIQSRSRETERAQSVQALPGSLPAAQEPKAVPAYNELNEVRQRTLLAQRTLARAQSVLGAMEGFRAFLGSAATPEAEQKAAEYIRTSLYHGEAVLEPHREALLRVLARGDASTLERMIGATRQNLLSLATAQDGSLSSDSPSVSIAAVAGQIIKTGGQVHQLQSENILKLLS